MPKLVWGDLESRGYEAGIDHGVLYLQDGRAVPWNGLVSVKEGVDTKLEEIYYDGVRVGSFNSVGEFKGSISAFTYPDEFEEVQGFADVRNGVLIGGQNPQLFGMCYRTTMNQGLPNEHYKLHLLFNLLAKPSDVEHATMGDSTDPTTFEWEISAIPEEIPGLRPTAHLELDSSTLDPLLLEDLETRLFGSDVTDGWLGTMSEMVQFLSEWYRVKIEDNGDGTWTATSDRPGFIFVLDSVDGLFEIRNINAIYVDDTTYILSDTKDISESPEIRFIDHGDGTWSANVEPGAALVMLSDTEFMIFNVDTDINTPHTWRARNTRT